LGKENNQVSLLLFFLTHNTSTSSAQTGCELEKEGRKEQINKLLFYLSPIF